MSSFVLAVCICVCVCVCVCRIYCVEFDIVRGPRLHFKVVTCINTVKAVGILSREKAIQKVMNISFLGKPASLTRMWPHCVK